MSMQSSAYNHSSANAKGDRLSLRPSVTTSNVIPPRTTANSYWSRCGVDIHVGDTGGEASHLLLLASMGQLFCEVSYESLISYLPHSHVVPVR